MNIKWPKKNSTIDTDETFVLVEATQASVNDLTQPLTSLMTMFAVFKHRIDPDPAVRKMISAMELEIERMGEITRKLSRLTEDTTRTHHMCSEMKRRKE